MSKSTKKSKRKAESRDVEFSAWFEIDRVDSEGNHCINTEGKGATLTARDAALVNGVLGALLPLLDKEATV